MYPEVSISATAITERAASAATSHSLPGARRRLVSQPSPITRDRPGEIALRGTE